MATIPKDSIVLVTGVNGFIASHVADQFLTAGYRVRGTVRSVSKGQWLQEMFDKKYGKGKFELEIVEDMGVEGAFDKAVKGVSGIAHVASVLTFDNDPNKVIPPTIASVTGILNSALQESNDSNSIKSFVYTSSSTAALSPQPNKPIIVTKDSWNNEAVENAWKTGDDDAEPDGTTVYSASKTEAEKALWKFVEERKPNFQVVSVLPNANFGELFAPELQGSTGAWIPKLFKGDFEKDLLEIPPQYYVNVKDTARIHVAALTDPSQNNQRIFAFAAPYNFNDIFAIFRKLYPDRKFVDDVPGLGRDLSVVSNAEAEGLLKRHFGAGWVGLEETVAENLIGIV